VAPAVGATPLNQVKTLRPTFEEIKKGIPEVKELWRDTFGV
jgi:iron(III) transport system substrate-binding protein